MGASTIAVVTNIDAHTLTRVWQEIEYRIDVLRVTRGAHIEPLSLSKKIWNIVSMCAVSPVVHASNLSSCQKTFWNIVSMCAVSSVVHTSNISSCHKKTFSVFLWL
jgi:hypothetical protein